MCATGVGESMYKRGRKRAEGEKGGGEDGARPKLAYWWTTLHD
jgi:hypothetical protein